MLITLARASLWSRKLTVLLTVVSIAVSTFIILGVDHLKNEMRSSFSRTVSGVDLIVGARTGPTNLLLYSVFRIGNPTNNISWQSYQRLSQSPEVAWAVPISLGDSHKGYRVLGTSTGYFEHFKYGQSQPLKLKDGQVFGKGLEAVIGAEVAAALGYSVGSELVISHGTGDVSFTHHAAHPFKVTGILAATGTPVDQTVHVSLGAIEAIHETPQETPLSRSPKLSQNDDGHDHSEGSVAGSDQHGEHDEHSHDHRQNGADSEQLIPDSVSAMLVGLKSRIGVLTFQRKVNQYQDEALLGIIPGVALSELWQMMGMAERALALIALLVLVASMLGMTTMLLASMREREREIAVLRAIGAHASFVVLIIEMEAVLIALAGAVMGYLLLAAALAGLGGWITSEYGLFISALPLSASTWAYLGLIVALAAVLALIPAWLSYRGALARGLSVRM